MDELLTQVTENDEVIGPISRRLCHGNPAIIHRSVHILVLNRQGELLLQKRSMTKDVQPGKWDTSVGGHVGFGQSYLEAAQREAMEELGCEFSELTELYDSKIRNSVESENIRTYWVSSDGPFIPQASEIDELAFWPRTKIESNLRKKVFTSNFEEEFQQFIHSPFGHGLK